MGRRWVDRLGPPLSTPKAWFGSGKRWQASTTVAGFLGFAIVANSGFEVRSSDCHVRRLLSRRLTYSSASLPVGLCGVALAASKSHFTF